MRRNPFFDPIRRAPLLRGWLALAILGIIVIAVSVPVLSALYRVPLHWAFALGLSQGAALLLAPRAPRTALGLGLASWFFAAFVSGDTLIAAWPWPWPVPLLISTILLLVILAATQRWQLPVIGWGIAVLGTVVVIAEAPGRYAELEHAVASGIVFTSVSAGVLLITLLLVQRGQIREQLARERQSGAQEQARRELIEERARIARELHDVVAHGMSVIQVQASSAKYRLPEAGPEAAAEFDDIAATARGALGEMRQLLGVLRGADTASIAGDALGPQPGLFDLPALVETTRRAGVPVTLDWDADSRTPATVGLTAYRVAQESLSNIIRHAPGAPARVTVRGERGALVVTVENEPSPEPAAGARIDPGGHGLRGMRERVALVGGTLEHGPTPAGGYRVRASLPDPHSADPRERPTPLPPGNEPA